MDGRRKRGEGNRNMEGGEKRRKRKERRHQAPTQEQVRSKQYSNIKMAGTCSGQTDRQTDRQMMIVFTCG